MRIIKEAFVYLDDNVPECMTGVLRIGSIEIYENGELIESPDNFALGLEFHTPHEVKDYVAKLINIYPDSVIIE